jgi:hypothetical protein
MSVSVEPLSNLTQSARIQLDAKLHLSPTPPVVYEEKRTDAAIGDKAPGWVPHTDAQSEIAGTLTLQLRGAVALLIQGGKCFEKSAKVEVRHIDAFGEAMEVPEHAR